MTPKLFVAGSTGETGKVLVAMARERGVDVRAHARPKPGRAAGPDVFELSDAAALRAALAGRTTAVQLIGTMRKRFSSGDTYDTSDIATTRALIEAAKAAGVGHFLLLSSAGAGRPMGAYLRAKAAAERVVIDGGVPWTIFRPSVLVGGDDRRAPPGMDTITRLFGLHGMRPIRLKQLAGAMLRVAADGAPVNAILEGRSLWERVPAASPGVQ